MKLLEQWLVAHPHSEMGTVSYRREREETFRRFQGNYYMAAQVLLCAEPCDGFRFETAPGVWPNPEVRAQLEPFVVDGILKATLACDGPPPLRVQWTLLAVEIDEDESTGLAFELASRLAAKGIIELDADELTPDATVVGS